MMKRQVRPSNVFLIVRRIAGEKGGPCGCHYIGSGEKTRRHGERAGRREGAKRDDEVTVPVWILTGRGGLDLRIGAMSAK